jgi:probable phosphoglycerate mutase
LKTVILVRHGSTQAVDQQIIQGRSDLPLNENGLRQIAETADHLKIVPARHIYSSPLKRCMQGAQAIAANIHLNPIPLAGLKERDFGLLEGKPYEEGIYLMRFPAVRFIIRCYRDLLRSISAESLADFNTRVMSAWQQILDENHNDISIVVSHSFVFNAIFINYFGRNFPKGMRHYPIRPCSISEIEINDAGQARLVRMDDVGHLSEYH